MRIPHIPRPLLRSVISIYREDEGVQNDVGEWTPVTRTVLDSVRANIQPDDARLEWDMDGKQHIQTHSCYFNKYEAGVILEPRAGDLLVDSRSGMRHRVLGILSTYSEDDSGYLELALRFLEMDDRFYAVKKQTVRAKCRIKTDSGTQRTLDVKAKIV
jgi:hypothetical protein